MLGGRNDAKVFGTKLNGKKTPSRSREKDD